jgi:hypothetical protein
VFFDSTRRPEYRRTRRRPAGTSAAVAKIIVNGVKTDMVNGALLIACRAVPCYRKRPGIRAVSGAIADYRRQWPSSEYPSQNAEAES